MATSIKKFSNKESHDLYPFSEEINEMILLNACYFFPEDMRNVCNAHPMFHRILHPYKNIWLFNQVFPLLYNQLTKTDTLNCRLVCHGWRKAVTHFLQNHEIRRDYAIYRTKNDGICKPLKSDIVPPLIVKDFYTKEFPQVQKIQKFIRDTTVAYQNKAVILPGLYLGNDQELFFYYWDHALDLLTKFGVTLLNVCLDVRNTQSKVTYVDKYKVLRRALEYMPNIKSLELYGMFSNEQSKWSNSSVAKLSRYIQKYPLPKRVKLEYLQIRVFDEIPDGAGAPILTEIFRVYSNHLKKLTVSVTVIKECGLGEVALPSVTDLVLVDCKYQATLVALKKINAPNLLKLTLSGDHFDRHKFLSGLSVIINLQYSLLHWLCLEFTLDSPISRKMVKSKATQLNFSSIGIKHLKQIDKLEILNFDGYRDVNMKLIMAYVPNLKHIVVCDKRFERSEKNDSKFRASESKYFDSRTVDSTNDRSVWDLLKKLRICQVGLFGDEALGAQVVRIKTFTR